MGKRASGRCDCPSKALRSATWILVREHGKNVPVVLTFAAEDDDGDGTLLVEIMPMPEAEDGNTILSALWVFPADLALEPQDILQGKRDAQALARIDADAPPNMPRPIRLTWPTGQLNGGESFELMVALPQGGRARRQLAVGTPAVERQRCIEYWQNAGLPYDRIVVPDRAVQDSARFLHSKHLPGPRAEERETQVPGRADLLPRYVGRRRSVPAGGCQLPGAIGRSASGPGTTGGRRRWAGRRGVFEEEWSAAVDDPAARAADRRSAVARTDVAACRAGSESDHRISRHDTRRSESGQLTD